MLAQLLFALALSARAQAPEVPAPVAIAFATQFPGAHVKKWEERKEVWWATFRLHGKKCQAGYSPSGAWEATETPVSLTRNLPAPVRTAWENSQYRDWLIFGIKKTELPGHQQYTIHVARVQALGPDDADIAEEDNLVISEKGGLSVEKLSR
ncbi:MAG: hypothetical protein JST42_16745 [Bacteroidetes bacterium]|nr:hypothetical protein [Bacteroidota bacterium]